MCGDHWGRGGDNGNLSCVMLLVGVGPNSLGIWMQNVHLEASAMGRG